MRVPCIAALLVLAAAACSTPAKNDPDGGTASGQDGGGSVAGQDAGTASGAHLCPGIDDPSVGGPNAVYVAADPGTEAAAHMTGSAIDKDWTLDPSRVYVVGQAVTVEGATLTVPAGTALCLTGQGSLSVGPTSAGAIKVLGTAERHVVITGFAYDGEPDFHQGLKLGQNAKGSEIHWLDIWYGGRGGGSAAYAFDLHDFVEDGDPLPVLDHLTVGELQSKGVALRSRHGVDPSSHLEILGYAPPVSSPPPTYEALLLHYGAATDLDASNTVVAAQRIPQASRFVRLDVPSGILSRDAALNDLGLPFQAVKAVISGGAKWTINAGVTVQFSEGIVVGDAPANSAGDLVVAGTAERRVVLTAQGAAPAAGDWCGVFFNEGLFDPAVSSLSHVDLLFGGGDCSRNVASCGTQKRGTITIDGAGQFAGPAMSSVAIDDSAAAGVAARSAQVVGDEYLTTDYTSAVTCGSRVAGSCLDVAKCQ